MTPNLPHYLLVKTQTPEHIPEGSYDLAPASSLPVPQPQGPAALPQRHHALRPSSLCTHRSLGPDYPDNLLLPGTINSFRKPSLSLPLCPHPHLTMAWLRCSHSILSTFCHKLITLFYNCLLVPSPHWILSYSQRESYLWSLSLTFQLCP